MVVIIKSTTTAMEYNYHLVVFNICVHMNEFT